jgi:hypothetical protein
MFAEQANVVQWRCRQPQELARTIDLALRLELLPLAAQLAQEGARLFPRDKQFQQMVRVLTPPAVAISKAPPIRGLKASRDWIRNNAAQYQGQWVAVFDGQLLAAAKSPKELSALLDPGVDLKSTIITEIQ